MRRLTALLFLPLLLLAAGCGEKEEPDSARGTGKQRFRVVLDYFPNADHAGLYAAQAKGEYRRAGLDVELKAPPDPSAPLKLLLAGKADVAISYEPELLLARDKGADLVSVAALVQKPLTSLMAIEGSGVRGVKDLAGKKVGTAGIPYQSAYLRTLLAQAGVDRKSVKELNVGFDLVPAMISHKVDATLGSFWNYEGTDLERRKRKPAIVRMEQAGVPTYNELIVVARRKDLDRDGAARLRRFLQATARGHEDLRADPEAAIDALLDANDDLERGLQSAVVRKTLPVFFPADKGKPWGYQDRAEWGRYGAWMLENHLVAHDPAAAGALTDEFLPGEALAGDGSG